MKPTEFKQTPIGMIQNPSLALDLLKRMKRIRSTEDEIARRYAENKMRCPTHLSIGQEAVPAAAGIALENSDLALSTHRCHGHYLGKGGSIPEMIAELYGKATGCSQGFGGSMHLIDRKVGFMGSTAIVGNSIPVGVGLGLGMQYLKQNSVSCIFLGDAAIEEGVFWESANFAAVRKLPVLFLCENNFYSVYSKLDVRQPNGRRIFRAVEGLGIKVAEGDGNNVLECHDMIAKAAAECRAGEGPRFLEFITYRWREHCGPNYDNHLGYRTEEEYLEWKMLDPILQLEKAMLEQRILTQDQIRKIDSEFELEVKNAFDLAEKAPFPDRKLLKEIVFKNQTPASQRQDAKNASQKTESHPRNLELN